VGGSSAFEVVATCEKSWRPPEDATKDGLGGDRGGKANPANRRMSVCVPLNESPAESKADDEALPLAILSTTAEGKSRGARRAPKGVRPWGPVAEFCPGVAAFREWRYRYRTVLTRPPDKPKVFSLGRAR
jgi:hypothetical protein